MEEWKKLCWSGDGGVKCHVNAFLSPLGFTNGQSVLTMDQAAIDKAFWSWFQDKTKSINTLNSQFHLSLLYPAREMISGTAKVTTMRTLINFGAPLKIGTERYKNVNDRAEE